MTTVGRVRTEPPDVKLVALGHNTVRGAAGGLTSTPRFSSLQGDRRPMIVGPAAQLVGDADAIDWAASIATAPNAGHWSSCRR
jgi:hypothetical protein